MQKFTQKYTIITLIEPEEEGYEFDSSNWPLHVTIADTFSVECNTHELIDYLNKLSNRLRQVTAVAAGDKSFGSNGEVKVTILDMNSELIKLHSSVVNFLEEVGVVFNDPHYTKAGYRAHATIQPHMRLEKGDVVNFDHLALIDMFPDMNPHERKILKLFQLS